MSGYLLALLGVVGGLFAAAVGDMVSEEIRDRLDHLPHAILRLAACRLDASVRAAIYDNEWLPELIYILQGDEARPVSRVYHGVRFALGILITARRIARDLRRAAPLMEKQPSFQAVGGTEQPEVDNSQELAHPAPAGPAMSEPTVLRMLLGAQLRRLREAAGVTAERAGHEIRASQWKISRLETGRVGFKLRDIEDLLTLYGVTDEQTRSRLLTLARQAGRSDWWNKYSDILPGWFEAYLGLESVATCIRSFDAQFVPGLLQTEEYARAVVRLGHQAAPADEIERRVCMRLERRKVLARPQPTRIWVVMDEAALRRPIGGTAVMRAQLRHLAQVARMPNVILQVVPFASGGHVGGGSSFSILCFEHLDLPDVVYIEQLTSAVYLDEGLDVGHYLDVVDRLSGEALTPADTASFIEQVALET